ncbi:ankyrin repeat domain-containing protein [Candidatus Vondammii sp. HM_W22]|uniref:ankyrin repeat domain-containing protein n=1 Tax=Candidatus Vondammii sp. HM_W22 TaxID=2687299 RepID=UPI001F13DE5A|nr:ankyrin repeat domain-containing protein [Candidatus Vondammii sp. HM_W22]
MKFMLCLLLLLPASMLWAADNNQYLLVAAGLGQEQRVQDLLAQGGDANAKNAAGRPALVLAAFNGNVRTCEGASCCRGRCQRGGRDG